MFSNFCHVVNPILYYQFIKYAFGLVFAEDKEGVRLYLDEIPLNQEDKRNFVAHLYSLNNDHDFKAKGVHFVDKGISEVDSKTHLLSLIHISEPTRP